MNDMRTFIGHTLLVLFLWLRDDISSWENIVTSTELMSSVDRIKN